jgi:predicted enzyme related to lactoylglutathione lyase
MTTTHANPITNEPTAATQTNYAVTAWFEIPVQDFERARRFYERLMDVELREERMGPALMGVFPGPRDQTSGCIVAMEGYEPSLSGTVVYLTIHGDLQEQLDRAPTLGGAVMWPKTALPEGMGFFAQIRDSEGNRVGLYSTR